MHVKVGLFTAYENISFSSILYHLLEPEYAKPGSIQSKKHFPCVYLLTNNVNQMIDMFIQGFPSSVNNWTSINPSKNTEKSFLFLGGGGCRFKW